MIPCTRCGYSGPVTGNACPRCGQTLVQAAPAQPQRPTLILKLEAPQMPPREWEITDEPAGIGRLDDSDITVPDKSVSRQHARILPTPSGFDVEDLGSTNGTWLNDKQITDRRPLNNGDQLMIGDIPLRVVLRGAPAAVIPQVAPVIEQRVPEPRPQPPPLPAPTNQPPPGTSLRPGGPSTVFYDIDEALAAVQPQGSNAPGVVPTSGPAVQPSTRQQEPVDVSTAWDVTPAKGSEVAPPRTPPVIIDTRPAQAGGPNVDQPTLIAAEPVTAPDPRPPTPSYDPQPGPPRETRPTPRESQADATLWPQPATYDAPPATPVELRPRPSYDPEPGPPRETRPTPSYDPQPGPPGETRATPSYDPEPGPPRETRPTPSYDPQPGPPRETRQISSYDPQPSGTASDARPARTRPDIVYEPRATAQPEDLTAVNLIDLADRLATALRLFKGDTKLALWLFQHAGGQAAAQSFVEQAERAERNPDNPIEQARLLDLAPTAARLLEAAVMLANVVSSFQTPDDEAEANAPDLQPVPRT
jgi:pSer/pThr/pTyr-binding forkhead associated (FHA) protein